VYKLPALGPTIESQEISTECVALASMLFLSLTVLCLCLFRIS